VKNSPFIKGVFLIEYGKDSRIIIQEDKTISEKSMTKIMFLDESGDHSLDKIDPSYPVFVLAGCIFDLDYYSKTVEPRVNELKNKHFNTTSVILRSYDIRKQKGDFACLVDRSKREAFYNDLNDLIRSMDFKIIMAVIHKTKFKEQYYAPDNPYNLCFKFILERAVMFLGRSNEQLMFRMESRETHNDRKLAKVYEEFRSGDHLKENGHIMFKKEEIQSKFLDLSFNQKTQNIAGHQIADLVAYPVGAFILNKDRKTESLKIIKTKLHSKGSRFLNYGLKIFP